MPELFDMRLRALRRDRAARRGPELVLAERTFEDCFERISLLDRRFDSALLIGCPDSTWPRRVAQIAEQVDIRDPGAEFAAASGGSQIVEDAWEPAEGRFDLVLAIATLDTVNDLRLALRLIRYAMRANGLFIGAFAGGETLPRLRAAMRQTHAGEGAAVPHVHPRIAPSALAPLLEDAGFVRPVVDVDRLQLSYASFDRLVADLRAMAATNVLCSRPARVSRSQREAAAAAFEDGSGRTVEIMEILHFACWTPA